MRKLSHPSGKPQIHQRILVIEDDESFAQAIGYALEKHCKYDVQIATDSFEAENHMSRQAFDLVVTDWRLPETSGFGALLRAESDISMDPEAPADWFQGARVPVIVVTACDAAEIERARKPKDRFHFLGVVSKQQSLERIIDQIITIFRNSSASATA